MKKAKQRVSIGDRARSFLLGNVLSSKTVRTGTARAEVFRGIDIQVSDIRLSGVRHREVFRLPTWFENWVYRSYADDMHRLNFAG